MKYSKYIVLVFIYCWLYSGVGFAHDPAGSNGQLQYNDNGVTAGAEVYYKKYNQALWLPQEIFVGAGNPSPGPQLAIHADQGSNSIGISYGDNSGGATVVRFKKAEGSQWGIIDFQNVPVTIQKSLGLGVNGIPQATLDVNGYVKLKPYSEPPVPCTVGMLGTIVMNMNYDLCVCRAGYVTLNSRGSSGIQPVPTFYKLVRDSSKNCW